VGERAARATDILLVVGELGGLIGQAARQAGHPNVLAFDDKEEAAAALAELVGEGDYVLIKASRALALETVVARLFKGWRLATPEGPASHHAPIEKG